MHKIIISILAFLVNYQSYGFSLFDNRLTVYSCKSESDARNCTNCTKNQDAEFEFQINPQSQIVIQQIYEKGQTVGSKNLDECKIVDKNNWQCGSIRGNFIQTRQYQRINKGLFHAIDIVDQRAVNLANLNLPARNYITYSCAK